MNGEGSLYYPNNFKAYIGGWKDDCFQGKGILYNERVCEQSTQNSINYNDFGGVEDWVCYEGEFD